MKKKVFIHIGPPKTGSTAIQEMLDSNEQVLLEQGVLYPKEGRLKQGERYWTHRSGGRHLEVGPSKLHAALAWTLQKRMEGLQEAQCWIPFVQEIEQTSAPVIIVSAEGFYHLNKSQIEKIDNYLSAYDIHILFYLRDPYKRSVSLYQQMVKKGKLHQSFSWFLENYYIEEIEKQIEILSNWKIIFGEKKVIVKPYERLNVENELLSNFLNTLGLQQNTLPTRTIGRKNIGLNDSVIRQLQTVNYIHHLLGKQPPLQSIFVHLRNTVKGSHFQRLIGKFFFKKYRMSSERDKDFFKRTISQRYISFLKSSLDEKDYDYYETID